MYEIAFFIVGMICGAIGVMALAACLVNDFDRVSRAQPPPEKRP